jgi:adenosylcobinamide kinase/adenosylcobinamide-phosphate guanylyltransferase
LVLGGARSGKSAYAQAEAEAEAARADVRPLFIATAQAFDAEMADRIAHHQRARGTAWTTLEAPRDLAGAIAALGPHDVAVVDCLTLWLSNVLDTDVAHACDALIKAVAETRPRALWLVSNEVGMGIVPDNVLARQFRDHAGRLHQRIAAAVDGVFLIAAGLPLKLK